MPRQYEAGWTIGREELESVLAVCTWFDKVGKSVWFAASYLDAFAAAGQRCLAGAAKLSSGRI
jgi:hypothetical protein